MFGGHAVGHYCGKPALAVDEVEIGGVVDGVSAIFSLMALVVDSVLLGHSGHLRFTAGQANQSFAEISHIVMEYLRGVAFRVQGDEHSLHPPCPVTQLIEYPCQAGEFRGTDIGAVGVTEEEQHQLALKLVEFEGLVVVVGETEIAPQPQTVGLGCTYQRQAEQQQQQQRPDPPCHLTHRHPGAVYPAGITLAHIAHRCGETIGHQGVHIAAVE